MQNQNANQGLSLIGIALVSCGALGFSAKAVLIKLAYGYGQQVSPIILMTLRMGMSLPFFLLTVFFLERNGNSQPMSRKDILTLISLGIVGFYLAAYLDFVGLSYISASLERLILLLYPTLVVILTALIYRRPISRREGTALVVSYIGIIIVFAEELTVAGNNIALGGLLIFGSSLAFAIYLFGSGIMVKRLGSRRFTAYAMSIACVATMVHFSCNFDPMITELPGNVYLLALIMALFSTVLPTFLMNAGIQRMWANPAAIISSLGPVMTLFLAYIVLDESLTLIQALGAGLVISGIFVVTYKKS